MLAEELWGYASGVGKTPWEALHDPHVAFNLSVYRFAQAARTQQFDMMASQLAGVDTMGLERILQALRQQARRG